MEKVIELKYCKKWRINCDCDNPLDKDCPTYISEKNDGIRIQPIQKIEIEPSPLSKAFKIIDDLILMIEEANWPEAFANENVYVGIDEGVIRSIEFFENIKREYKELKDESPH